MGCCTGPVKENSATGWCPCRPTAMPGTFSLPSRMLHSYFSLMLPSPSPLAEINLVTSAGAIWNVAMAPASSTIICVMAGTTVAMPLMNWDDLHHSLWLSCPVQY
nr:uncharacterized protein LOC128697199 [Cherax quadricarinatus]